MQQGSGRLATWGTLAEQARWRHQSEAAHGVALDVSNHLPEIVGNQQQTQVCRIDGSRRGQLRQQLLEWTPVRRADENNWEVGDLARLNERQRLHQLVERTE